MENINLNFEEKFLLILNFSEKNNTLITRAIKLFFLIEKVFDIKGKNDLEFIPSDYGPYAINFNLNLTPLINEELISYKDTKYKEFFFNKSRESEIKNVLNEEFIKKDLYYNEIDLFDKLSKLYDHAHTNELIQLCYILNPQFADKSDIKEDIKNLDKKYNQDGIIYFFENLSEKYLLKLIHYIDRILDIFIDEKKVDKENFYNLINNISVPFIKGRDLNLNDLIMTIDNISINDPLKSYKFLKYKLLDYFSLRKTNKIAIDEYRKILIFIFKAFILDWSLDTNSIFKFKNYYKELKNPFIIEDFKEEIEPLELDYNLLRKELDSELYLMKSDKNDKVDKKLKRDHSKTQKIKKIDSNQNNFIESIHEDYSNEEIEELEESEEDYEKPIEI